MSVCTGIITYRAQQVEGELVQGYTLLSRAGKACIAYVTYLYKMIWPVDLAVIYPFSKYPPGSARIVAAAAILLLISVVVVWASRRLPYLATGWFWYLVTLLPVSGLIQIGQHSVADRYTYIPLIGIFIMLVWGGAHFTEGWKQRRAALITGAAVLLAAMITLTSLQLRYWKNDLTLFSHAIEVTKDNWVARNNLGLVYLEAGKVDEAIVHLTEAVKAKPSFALAHFNLGVAYAEKYELEKAIEAFGWVLRFEPRNEEARYSIGRIHVVQGEKQLAMEQYRELQKIGSPLASKLMEFSNSLPPLDRTYGNP